MGFTNKQEASIGNTPPNLGYINEIPTNVNNEIKAANFHNWFNNFIDWIFPGVSAPSGNGGSLVSSNNYELSWDILMPIGGVIPYAGATAPNGWLLCDGSEYLIANYPDLNTVMGGAFNGAIATTPGYFRVPNLKGRQIIGLGKQNFNISTRETTTPTYTMGNDGGLNKFIQTTLEMPSHQHGSGSLIARDNNGGKDSAHSHGIPNDISRTPANVDFSPDEYGGINGSVTHSTATDGRHEHNVTGFTGFVGSNLAMENRSPYLVLNYIIKT